MVFCELRRHAFMLKLFFLGVFYGYSSHSIIQRHRTIKYGKCAASPHCFSSQSLMTTTDWFSKLSKVSLPLHTVTSCMALICDAKTPPQSPKLLQFSLSQCFIYSRYLNSPSCSLFYLCQSSLGILPPRILPIFCQCCHSPCIS